VSTLFASHALLPPGPARDVLAGAISELWRDA
jgi:hypothetical protein